MRNLFLGVAAAALLLNPAIAQTVPSTQLTDGVYRTGDLPALETVQYIYGGRNYCWYDGGWDGPGYYWCGYAWRSGFGWGGGYGWQGWQGGHRGGGRSGSGHGGGGRTTLSHGSSGRTTFSRSSSTRSGSSRSGASRSGASHGGGGRHHG
jgi:hypothetical protein